jgi:hypothetical protein
MSPYNSKNSWLSQTTNTMEKLLVPSLLVPSLPNIGISMTLGGAIGSHGYGPMRRHLSDAAKMCARAGSL